MASLIRLALFLTVLPFVLALNKTNQTTHHIVLNGTALYKPLFAVHSNSTPRFQNISGVTVNPLIKALLGQSSDETLRKRQELPTGTCAPGTPCVNGACCSNTGICGYSPTECGTDYCISNCDAKAECGQYGVEGENICPINVCCSKFGSCGVTDDFCLDECQEGFGGCGAVKTPSCGGVGAGRAIGYYEGWSSKRSCDTRLPSDLDLTGLTHINFAFAFFHPTTFQIVPMDPDDLKLYPQFTALKKKKSSLKTWISVGGWSFNDATNTPNTQTAFSDMASTSANRKIFITSLLQFMKTWGFDGVDLDWEYPGAPDRGGIDADTENFVALLRDMREAFGNVYGTSVTLPASYWYLRWFNLKDMEQYLDFFNVMTYDIHGVWDSTNKFTGPYIRPHTNLTEIEQGLDLLWRNDITPGNVNLGLGWYGRSFTLSDPSCNTPGCIFTAGGSPGECTKSSGTLSNAEIFRIIEQRGLTPQFNKEAGVKWITWDDQWVSYDDGETTALKLAAASRWCLGGKLIWAMDLDDTTHTSTYDLLGMGTSNGVTPEIAAQIKAAQLAAEVEATVRNSCYWSFCGDSCTAGYFPETTAKGQVLGISRDTVCKGDSYQTLCCAPGTDTGTCAWEGWRGIGMSCLGAGCTDTSAALVAMNTNQYNVNGEVNNNLTCNGGSQSYCCKGFSPSPKLTTDDLVLVGKNGITKRASGSGAKAACTTAVNTGALVLAGLFAFVSFGLSVAAGVGVAVIGNAACQATGSGSASGNAVGVIPLAGIGALGPNGGRTTTSAKTTVTGKPAASANTYGNWGTKAVYGQNDVDCAVTYTCSYGMGWDEICDNQRWAIDKILNGRTVFHVDRRAGDATKKDWDKWRVQEFHTLARQPDQRNIARCQVDEFPMGALIEARQPNPQAVRLVNGPANGAQGIDFKMWKIASWSPCSDLRILNGKPEPPATWKFGPFAPGDRRINAAANGQHFIQKYGFDSQTLNSLCWATFTYNGGAAVSTVSDHGFRALVDDPMFNAPYNWPRSRYDVNPFYFQPWPADVASAAWLKRSNVQSVLAGKLPVDYANAEFDIIEDQTCDDGDEECLKYEAFFDSPPPPMPTHLASSPEINVDGTALASGSPTAAERATQAPTILPSMPVETGHHRHLHQHKAKHRGF